MLYLLLLFSLPPQRILQPYVDAVFDSIFTVSQGRSLPKAIKSLFDFLDLQASELGIQDPEILHTWKTNRYDQYIAPILIKMLLFLLIVVCAIINLIVK